MWCRPEPSSVSPIYMPGRLRTASRPFKTLMEPAPYSSMSGESGGKVMMLFLPGECAGVDEEDVGARGEAVEQREIRSGHPRLRAERQDFFKECMAALEIEMRRHFVEQQDRRMAVAGARELPGVGEHDGDQKRLLLAC